MKKFAFILAGIIFYTGLYAQYKKIESNTTKENNIFGSFSIPHEKYELDNGMTVIINEDHSDPVVSLNFLHKIGSSASYADRTEVMYLISYLLYEMNESVNSDFYTDFGGKYDWNLDIDKTNCRLSVPSDLFESALSKESKRLFEFIPGVSQVSLQNAIEVILQEELNKQSNNGFEKAEIYARKALYPFAHPYSWQITGKTEQYQSAALTDIKKFYSEWFGANNLILSISGDINTEDAIKLVSKYFSNYPATAFTSDKVGNQIDLLKGANVDPLTKNRYITHFNENTELKTPFLRMVYPSVSKYTNESVALNIAAFMLDNEKNGSLSKLLYSAKLAEDVHVYHKTYKHEGEFIIEVIAKPGVSLAVIKDTIEYTIRHTFQLPEQEMDQKRREQKEGEVIDIEKIRMDFENRQFELDRRMQLLTAVEIGKLLSGFELSAHEAKTLADYEFYLGNPNSLSNELSSIQAINPSSIFEIANQFIVDKPAVIISVLPKGKAELKAGVDNHKIHELESIVQPTLEEEIANIKIPTASAYKAKLNKVKAYPFPIYKEVTLENGLKYFVSPDLTSQNFFLTLRVDFNNIRTLLENPKTEEIILVSMYSYMETHLNGDVMNQLIHSNTSFDFKFLNNHLIIEVETSPNNLNVVKEILREMFLSNHPIHVDMESIVDQLSTEKKYLTLNPHHLFSDLLINRMFPMQEMQKQDYITDKDELMVMVLRLSERYVYLFEPLNTKVFITGNAPEGQMSDLIENFRQWQSVPTGDVVAKIQGDTLPFGKQFYYCDFKRNEKADVLVNYLNLPVDVDENTRAKYFNHILGKQDGLLKEYLKLNSNISDFGSFEKITGNVHSYYLSFQTDYDSAAKVINELLSHINALATTKSNKKDLKLWTGQYLRLENCKYESNSSKACLLNSINTENLPNDYFSSRMKVVKKTKGGKLKKFVSATINPDEMQFLVIGNKEKIIKQFDKSGLGTMKEVSFSGKIINN